MRGRTLVLVLALALAVITFLRIRAPRHAPDQQSKVLPGLDVSTVCPWRDPKRDLAALFPSATHYVPEPRIVSGMTAEIVKRLGRQMTPDENPLRIFRAQSNGHTLGSVLVTRVRGEHGGIETVIGINTSGVVNGVRIQSQREPDEVTREITSSDFLTAFVGKTFSSRFHLADDLPELPPSARASAQAIADGVRSQMIVLSFAERLAEPSGAHTNH